MALKAELGRIGLLGFNASATARVISRFGLVYWGLTPQVWFGLLGFNASATARVISRFGLVYWGLTPQQQPGSYQGGEMMMMKSDLWWRKLEYPGETTDLWQVTPEPVNPEHSTKTGLFKSVLLIKTV